jgi:predicted phage terminase large subunit-like protein
VEDDENTRTAERLKGLLSWFTGTIMQLREPHSKMVVVGTLKTTASDIYNFVLGNPAWSAVVKSAILHPALEEIDYEPVCGDDGRVVDVALKTTGVRVLWPQKWPIEALLLEMLASIRSIWVREKLNDLRALAGKVFKREWFRYCDEMPLRFDQVVQAWDTAYEEDQEADWSACVTLGLLEGRAYVLDVFRARLEFPELRRAMEEQYKRWQPRAVLVEDRASGKSARQVLTKETGLPVVAVSPGGRDKQARARAVTPYYESGRVLHRAGAPWLDAFEDELTLFPGGEHDDQLDALVYGLLRLFLGQDEEKTHWSPAQVARADMF